ncbi:CC_3452 family protein [Aurantiacibacter luteus]|uniref:CC_3452 family protein n=1 Tax=Aurantiacibacter luteus TaxID=1581420 RepID=UPI0012DFF1AE|nr:hypothetical protein [Aurantiacibacter luteus]
MSSLGAPLPAAADGPYFRAELAAPTQQARAIAGGVMFQCHDTTCLAGRSGHRPLRVCRQLVREVGAVTAFSADGEAFSEDEIARCNA